MRVLLFASALGLVLTGFAAADEPVVPIRLATNIPPEDLGSALKAFARARKLQLLYRTQLVDGVESHGAAGKLTADETLTQLLQGTGLTYRHVDSNTITLVRSSSPNQTGPNRVPAKAAATGESAGKEIRVALSGTELVAAADPSALPQADTDGSTGEADVQNASGIKEVVVTAQKYTQPAFNVPVSLDVISGASLQRLGDRNLEDLQFAVPGLVVQDNEAQRRIIIGGVGNVFGLGGLVGEYIDEADATSSPSLFGFNSLDIRTYDLARVEVLRGPQGTLYGEGSVGGAMHLVTNEPVLDRFEMGLRAETLFTKRGAQSEHVFPVVNIPLVEGTLGVRIAGEFDHDGGWINLPAAGQNDVNSSDLADTRIEALWKPSSRFQASALEIIHRKTYGITQGEDGSGNMVQPFDMSTVPNGRDHYGFSNLTLQYDASSLGRLISTSTYYDDDNVAQFGSYSQSASPPAPPLAILHYPNKYEYQGLTQELRLTQSSYGPWGWTIGGIYKRVRTNNFPTALLIGAPSLAVGDTTPSALLADPRLGFHPFGEKVASNSWAVFADISYVIMDKLTLGVGARHFKDDENTRGVSTPLQSGSFNSTDPRAYVLYNVSRHINVYANAAKGFRSGGFNGFGSPAFGPESVWHYELGIKTREIRGLVATADINYSNYANYQVVGYNGPIGIGKQITLNGGTVHIKGAEAGITWIPLNLWTFQVTADYVDARFVKVPQFGGTTHNVGDPVDEVPRYQVDTAIQRDFALGVHRASVRVDYMQRAKEYYRQRDIGPWYYSSSDNLYFLNLDVEMQWTENLRFGFMGRNILDDRGTVDPFTIETGPVRSRPLTVGVYFDTDFE